MERLKVDIVCPVGGYVSGVEKVIRSWTENINGEKIDLRVICLGPTAPFLGDYKKGFYVTQQVETLTIEYLVEVYCQVIDKMGAPDICIATVFPIMVEAAVNACKLKGVNTKVVSWIHNELSYYDEGSGDINNVLKAKYHLALTNAKAEELKSVSEECVTYVIGNPIDVSAIINDKVDCESKNPLLLTYIGRLTLVKRLDIVLEALLKTCFPYRLRIIGDGELKGDVEKWIEILKLEDRVEMIGWKDNPILECTDSNILVGASDTEGFPLTYLEALAAGMTVITTPVSGVKDVIKEGINGYYFNFDSADSLAKVLDDIAEGRKQLCDSNECRESIMKYDKSNYFTEVERVLFEIDNS